MARPDLRKGRSTRLLFHRGTGLLRSLGHSTLPVSLPILKFPLVSNPRTRMVPRNRLPRARFPANNDLERLNHPRSPTIRCASNINLPSPVERSPRQDRCKASIGTHQVTCCNLSPATNTTNRPAQGKAAFRSEASKLVLEYNSSKLLPACHEIAV